MPVMRMRTGAGESETTWLVLCPRHVRGDDLSSNGRSIKTRPGKRSGHS